MLLRYYNAGVVNTIFGFGAFAVLVWLGLWVYLAQILSTIAGVAFNYVTYSRYAFAGHRASKWRFVASYGVNYLLSVAVLWGFLHVLTSPYLAGLAAVAVVSVVNFFILKRLVFAAPDLA